MCGVVGFIGSADVAEILFNGLKTLEYRGYDSAGLALCQNNSFHILKAVGKLENLLRETQKNTSLAATMGIGHIRWATHGAPSLANAHPHISNDGKTVLVHNGIIENYKELKADLSAKGYRFSSDTDTEVAVVQIEDELKSAASFPQAVRQAMQKFRGSFAFLIMNKDNPQMLLAAKRNAPLLVGRGEKGMMAASDVPALAGHVSEFAYLDDDELALLSPQGMVFQNAQGSVFTKPLQVLSLSTEALSKNGFDHFMLKEINEQPAIVRSLLQRFLAQGKIVMPSFNLSAQEIENLTKIEIVACGTSLHAATVGKYVIEELADIPVEVEAASEYIYRKHPKNNNILLIGVSQSGETADTISAVKLAKQRGAHVLVLTNREDSSLVRFADSVLGLNAGLEISVAATKSYTAQLMMFYLLALYLAQERKTQSLDILHKLQHNLMAVPVQMEEILADTKSVQLCAEKYAKAQDFIYVSRGVNVATALEGALKLKEISYINANAYPAGELKHGPIALLDEKMPVLSVLMPGSPNYDKLLSNSQEAKARHARLIAVTSARDKNLKSLFDDVLQVPEVPEILSPLTANIPLQLLAYFMANKLGRDVDKPRNLAKSVTVE